ncbi:MAG TPA: class I SAM-dependent methyltransferase [Alphaproteobacteria bacterium]|jgi:SAM-dependent methyltransferase
MTRTTSDAAGSAAAIEQRVASHYANDSLEKKILDALVASGKDPDRLEPADLSPVDEFHTGGREATVELAARGNFAPGSRILDIGCGIGGASRYFAVEGRCLVTGIDLTEDYVRTAAALAVRVGLGDRVTYREASALALPFEPASFDGAYMIHVGMNIEDKPRLFAEVRRVVKRGGTFALFDIMRSGDRAPSYPMPWAETAETSFLASPAEYRRALEAAGFEITGERDRTAYAREFFGRAVARARAAGGPPPLGIHLLMKAGAQQKIANILSGLDSNLIAPTEIVCRAR